MVLRKCFPTLKSNELRKTEVSLVYQHISSVMSYWFKSAYIAVQNLVKSSCLLHMSSKIPLYCFLFCSGSLSFWWASVSVYLALPDESKQKVGNWVLCVSDSSVFWKVVWFELATTSASVIMTCLCYSKKSG